MKKIAIITCMMLLLGSLTLFAQQAKSVLVDETGAVLEQTAPSTPPPDVSRESMEGGQVSPMVSQPNSTPMTAKISAQTVERDETMGPDGRTTQGNVSGTKEPESNGSQIPEYHGPDEAEGPLEVKPDKK